MFMPDRMSNGNGTQPRELTHRVESLACMAYGISHDFNNLLAAILSNAQAALGQLPPDDATRPYVEHIVNNSKQAIALINRIQVLTESGTASREIVSLANIIAQTIKDLHADAPPACHICMDDIDNACTITVIPDLLRDSIMALVQNACDAIGDSTGTIWIRVRQGMPASPRHERVVLGTLDATPCVMLEVEDNGTGIPDHALHRIFDPFFTTRLRAPGLGLTSVVGLTTSCNVTLHVETKPDHGTLMRLCFAK